MHVLWINDDATLAGGCEHYILRTVTALRSNGVRSSLIYDPARESDPAYLKAFDAAFPHVDLQAQLPGLKPDIIYVHQLDSPRGLLTIGRSGIPSVRFIHDHRLFCLRDYKYTTLGHHTCTRVVGLGCYPCLGFVRRSPSWPGVSLTRVGSLLREQQASMFFHAIITGSRYMADHVIAHGFDRTRVEVIPPFAPLPVSMPGVLRDDRQLLFVGQIIRGKGIDLLLHALSMTRLPCRLVLAGDGRQRGEYERMTRDLGLEDRVRFLGKLPSDALSVHYQQAAVVVFPSRSPETFGLVGLEAMTHSTPVVATAVGGVGEWLEDGVNGLSVPSGDAKALAHAIDRLLENPADARRMGMQGRRIAESKFQQHHHVARLHALFSTLIAGDSSR